MYRVENSGSTVGKSGRRWQWDAGDVIEEAPKGELDHVGGVEWDKGEKAITDSVDDTDLKDSDKPLDGTKDEIKAWLDANEVEYDPEALKADLLEILENA